MKQRALFASALVLGCVTIAAAGGCRAGDQTTASDSAATAPTGTPMAEVVDPNAGTVAEIGPAAPPEAAATRQPEPTPRSGGAARVTARSENGPYPTQAESVPNPVRSQRVPSPETATAAGRPASTTATRPAPSPQAEARTAPRTAPRTTPQTATATPPSTATAQTSSAGNDTWPARDSGPANDRNWPSRDAGGTTSTAEVLPSRTPVSEPSAPPAPVRRLETVTIPADAVINVQLETGASSVNAKVEDTVRARITRDVVAGGDVVIPAGSRLMGSVTLVEEGGRLRERARLGVRFHTVVLANGTEVRLPTETIYREGESPAGRSAAKIGGAAVGGAILGAIMGGGKGAVIGAATGAGSGTGWAMAGDRRPAELRSGQALAVRISDAVRTEVER